MALGLLIISGFDSLDAIFFCLGIGPCEPSHVVDYDSEFSTPLLFLPRLAFVDDWYVKENVV